MFTFPRNYRSDSRPTFVLGNFVPPTVADEWITRALKTTDKYYTVTKQEIYGTQRVFDREPQCGLRSGNRMYAAVDHFERE